MIIVAEKVELLLAKRLNVDNSYNVYGQSENFFILLEN